MAGVIFFCAGCETHPYSDDTYRIGGFISGYQLPEGLTIRSQSGEVMEVVGRQFSFDKQLMDNDVYSVTIAEQPDVQICKVINGSGVVDDAHVDDIEIHCRSWLMEKTFFKENSSKALSLALDKDSNQHTVAAWQEDKGGSQSEITVRLYKDNEEYWFGSFDINRSSNATDPQLSAQGEREFVLAWESLDLNEASPTSQIRITQYNPVESTGPNVSVSRPGSNATEPAVASNDNADAIVLWKQADESGTQRVWSSSKTDAEGLGWTLPSLVSTDSAGGDVSHLQVAMNPNGEAVAIWLEQNNEGIDKVRANFYTPENGWLNVPFNLNADSQTDALTPDLTIDGNGNVVAVWVQQGNEKTTRSVWINTYVPGVNRNQWNVPRELEVEAAGNAALSPQVMAYKSTQAMVVWSQDDGTGVNRIWAMTHSPNGEWSVFALSNITAQMDVEGAEQPQIAQDDDGNVIVVWRQSIDGKASIWSNTYTPVSGWGDPVQIESTNADDSTEPLITMGKTGQAVVIWRKETSGDLLFNRFE
ncbi:hypothetical protein BGP77_17645 [Saccharospirillum sp. MSK14-1]|uniref:hypothetical protein n=1 Tax=Saccharospirillum sp. MSK14-1 TaxID=1897632 RepID=UPI000D358F5A|nr:hypothetical protein [Saccharospirillum sp. MSK14-1]PTY38263.1 hypothetical protein BGP77_17645 [Saccharospirillum sp. MSK14-1]